MWDSSCGVDLKCNQKGVAFLVTTAPIDLVVEEKDGFIGNGRMWIYRFAYG